MINISLYSNQVYSWIKRSVKKSYKTFAIETKKTQALNHHKANHSVSQILLHKTFFFNTFFSMFCSIFSKIIFHRFINQHKKIVAVENSVFKVKGKSFVYPGTLKFLKF